MRFVIQGRLAGINEYIAAMNSNRFRGNALKRKNQDAVCQAIKKAGLEPIKRKIFLKFTWIEPNMRRDKDNVAAAKKFILDALVEMKIIENDGWKYVEGFSDKFAVNKNNPRVIVELEEA